MNDNHVLCMATLRGAEVICSKAEGHVEHLDPRRQMHYDHVNKVAWGPEATTAEVLAANPFFDRDRFLKACDL